MRVDVSQIASPRDCADVEPSSSFLQSRFWGLFKSRTGWQAYLCKLSLSEGTHVSLLVLRRRLAKMFTFLYIPFGLTELEDDPSRWNIVADAGRTLRDALGGRDLFARFDIPWIKDNLAAPAGSDTVKSVDVQVPDTVVLNLTGSEEEILAGMKPKWRYNIRLAERKGISVLDEGEAALPEFMRLYQETARRDKIAIHPISYYRELFRTVAQLAEADSRENPRIALYIARHEGEALAGIIVLELDGKATYLYGASSDKKRNLMPAYALQWHAILSAKQRGATSYDFFGIPPEASDPSHPMAGLFLFKTGFGGQILHRCGGYDVPLRPIPYALFRGGEVLRRFWHKSIKKGLRRLLKNLRGA